MIDIIISITNNTSIQDIVNTLHFLRNEKNKDLINPLLVVSGDMSNELIKEETKFILFPNGQDIEMLKNDILNSSHMENFIYAFHSKNQSNNIVTFLKAGDLVIGASLFSIIEEEFKKNPFLLTLHCNIENNSDLKIYKNKKINLQGWFFNRDFLDYYSFTNGFKNEIEFTIYFSYITDLQPQYHKELKRTFVQIETQLSDIGETLFYYFNEVLPQQDFFNSTLGIEYIYDLICDIYITYIQATNIELEENEMNLLLKDIFIFYNYFKQLELEELEKLLYIYNKKIKEIYSDDTNSFLLKIPNITLLTFLDNLEKQE